MSSSTQVMTRWCHDYSSDHDFNQDLTVVENIFKSLLCFELVVRDFRRVVPFIEHDVPIPIPTFWLESQRVFYWLSGAFRNRLLKTCPESACRSFSWFIQGETTI